MIQRIQSLYMILAIALTAMLLAFPVFTNSCTMGQTHCESAVNIIPSQVPGTYMSDLEQGADTTQLPQSLYIHTWPLLALVILIEVITATALCMYKNRMRQVRWVAFAFLLDVLYIGLVFAWAVSCFAKLEQKGFHMEDVTTHFTVGTWLPIATALLLFLAQRAIKKDEQKVRAADRLR